MRIFNFQVPTKLIFGEGALERIGRILGSSYSKVLIVADPLAYEASGAKTILSRQLAKLKVETYSEIEENPSISSLDAGVAMAKELGAELIIGVGGGSAMDTAKGIAVLCTNFEPLNLYLDGAPLSADPLPIVCIPTTSGTGSEATPFAVFTGDKNKQGLSHPKLYPAISIVDPELTYSMPKSLIINTGLDALTHSIEAYLSIDSSPLSDALALEAAKTVITNLESASGGDRAAMSDMAFASMTAGIAIGHAGTILPHIMGYPLTFFHGVPHGLASAVLLPVFLDFLQKASSNKDKVKIAKSLFWGHGGAASYMRSLGVDTNLAKHGVDESEFETFADMTIVKSDIKITPAPITREVIIDLYKQSKF